MQLVFLVIGFVLISTHVNAESRVYALDDVLNMAQKQNPSVNIFRANLEASQGVAVAARAYPNPTVGVVGGQGKSTEGPPSSYQREFSAEIGQPLEWPLKRRYRAREADAGVASAKADIAAFQLDLVNGVKMAFYRLLLAKRELDVSSQTATTVERLRDSVRSRVAVGETPAFELMKANVEFMNVSQDVTRTKREVVIAKASLNQLLGDSLGLEFDIAGSFVPSRQDYDLASLIEGALDRHPLIRRQEHLLQQKSHALAKEGASRVPDVTLRGFAVDEIDRQAYALGLSIPLPFWYLREGEIAEARAQTMRADATLKKARIDLSSMITQAYQRYQMAREQLTVFEEGLLKQAEETLRIAEISFRQGESGLLDLLDAQRVRQATRLRYFRTLFDLNGALADLERAVGGLTS